LVNHHHRGGNSSGGSSKFFCENVNGGPSPLWATVLALALADNVTRAIPKTVPNNKRATIGRSFPQQEAANNTRERSKFNPGQSVFFRVHPQMGLAAENLTDFRS
jgi:hypothetical protein